MKYHYEIPQNYKKSKYGSIFQSSHPLYRYCTLYKKGNVGLAVVQKRFNTELKVFFYGPIDDFLVDDIYLNPRFESYFVKTCGFCQDGVYPTVNVRKLMWALKMKPLPKDIWEQELQLL